MQVLELGLQVIAQEHGDFQPDACLVAGRLQGGGTGLGVDTAGYAEWKKNKPVVKPVFLPGIL